MADFCYAAALSLMPPLWRAASAMPLLLPLISADADDA